MPEQRSIRLSHSAEEAFKPRQGGVFCVPWRSSLALMATPSEHRLRTPSCGRHRERPALPRSFGILYTRNPAPSNTYLKSMANMVGAKIAQCNEPLFQGLERATSQTKATPSGTVPASQPARSAFAPCADQTGKRDRLCSSGLGVHGQQIRTAPLHGDNA